MEKYHNLLNYTKENYFNNLTEEKGIKIREYENFYILSYSQIDSPKSDPIVQECRGHVIDKNTNQFLCRPFDRFFNLGEMNYFEKDFNIREFIILEKLDGTMINIWWNPYENKFNISTRSMAYGESCLQIDKNKTYYDLTMDILGNDFDFSIFDKSNTYIFELTSPENKVVTRYENKKLSLLGIRNNISGDYFNYDYMKKFINNTKLNITNIYEFNSFDNIMKAIKLLPALQEGYVAWNQKTNFRVKIKNPSYVAIAHLNDNGVISYSRICAIVLNNDEEEYLSYYPEQRYLFEPYIIAKEKMNLDFDNVFNELKDINDMKEIALKIKNKNEGMKYIIFNMKRGGLTYEQVYDKLTDSAKERMLEYYKG